MKVFVYGAGQCGRTLTQALFRSREHDLLGTWNRTREASQRGGPHPWPTFFGPNRPTPLDAADVVWLTVPDRHVANTAARLFPEAGQGPIVLHASGALPASALGPGPRAGAACHPLQAFAEAMSPPKHVAGIFFGLEGAPEALKAGASLVDAMGARHFTVKDETAKALYHAACCVASNALVALTDQAVELFVGAGIERRQAIEALIPLVRGTVDNLAGAQRPAEVLTGPIARGDTEVLAVHEAAISARLPDELRAYQRVCEQVRALKRRG